MTAMHARRSPRLVPFALTADDASAERWLAALKEAGIPAQIHIEDGTRLASGSSMFPTGPVFASAIYVAPECRDQAAKLLIDLGWDGRQLGAAHQEHALEQRVLVGGAVSVSLIGLVVVLLLRVI